ncbi:MAG: sensor histidine kinase, partial [Bacteroidales bacterium]|nr:sensor histidine kinase [Bacteroidales bacterium]
KLIRVLTHEIMNSITPIASLSSTLEIMLKGITDGGNVKEDLDLDTILEILKALQTINKRSTGLLHFVNTYRNLTRIPKPNFKIFPVKDLFKNIYLLMKDEISSHKIKFVNQIEPEDIEVSADEQLIEQVIINLIRNSIHALENHKNPVIELKAFFNKRGRVTMQVADNGTGILPGVLDKIFIPFFTTKQSGSGIGLSLSRQILRLHNGTITANSRPEEETVFTLTF